MNSNTDLNLEKFDPKDLNLLHDMIIKTILNCYPEYYPNEAVEFFINYQNKEAILKNNKEGYTIVLKKNGEIIGTGTLVGTQIKSVFVDPNYQKQGLGKIITQRLEEEAIDQNLEYVEIHSSLFAKSFYDRMGYRMLKMGKRDVDNGEILYYQRMVKPLIPFQKTEWKLHKKHFKMINGEFPEIKIDSDTIHTYYQIKNLLYVEYLGGKISYGEKFGFILNDEVDFNYEQEDINGLTTKGHCKTIIEITKDQILRLTEKWKENTKEEIYYIILEEIN